MQIISYLTEHFFLILPRLEEKKYFAEIRGFTCKQQKVKISNISHLNILQSWKFLLRLKVTNSGKSRRAAFTGYGSGRFFPENPEFVISSHVPDQNCCCLLQCYWICRLVRRCVLLMLCKMPAGFARK